MKERVPAILFYPPLFFKHYFAGRPNKSVGERRRGPASPRGGGPAPSRRGRKVNPFARVFIPRGRRRLLARVRRDGDDFGLDVARGLRAAPSRLKHRATR